MDSGQAVLGTSGYLSIQVAYGTERVSNQLIIDGLLKMVPYWV